MENSTGEAPQVVGSEHRFRTLARYAPVGIFLSDADGNCLFVNQKWCELAGMSPERAHGKGWADALHPADRERILHGWSQAVRVGEASAEEFCFRTPEGQVSWVHGLAVPLRSERGDLTGYVGTVMDITQRRQAEEALRESEQRFRQLAEAISEVFWMADAPLTKILYISPAYERVWGRSCQTLYEQPRSFLEAVHPEDQRGVLDALEQHRRGEPSDIEYRVIHADGVVRWVRDRGFPVTDDTGRVYRCAGIAEDITERRRAEEERRVLEEQLRQQNQALSAADHRKDEFLAMLAHELRNPLAPIRNALYLWKQPAASKDILRQAQAMAERQVHHMARLLDDLLDISRVSRGKIELQIEAVDVASLVNRTLEASRPLLEERRHELTLALPPEPLFVEGDWTRLEQVLTNLLTNACKYTEPSGHIRLTAEREDSTVVLRVKDDGIGIHAEMLPTIFDLFMQAERRVDRSQGGVGIGLTLVKKLVELHGGSVQAYSAGLGQGTEFVVRLPALEGAPAEQATPESDAPAAITLPSRRVLVVDDNEDAANSLALLLQLAGQEVRVAYDGPSALLMAQSFRPHLVLLDLGMPGMDGYEVARRLRQQPGTEKLRLVALTGWGQEKDRQRSLEAGFDRHLVKPLEPEALYTVLGESATLGRLAPTVGSLRP
jgi:PAS domain S-box-containing protein